MIKKTEQQKDKNIQPRPPVVVILGHVDSGKTSILDFIRKTKVVERESGGITQHIGAYEIEQEGKKITFIDTPGHEAFSAMRSRGAKVADIAILVVDSCEGVKAQTKEVIFHIKKSGIPVIAALNKTDRPEANPEKVKRELSQEDILVESMGGKIPSVEVSAKTGQGISELLELILLVAEMENLKAEVQPAAQGAVIEAYLDSLRGPTATLILNQGILMLGQIVATSSTLGKVKNLENFQGINISKAIPSQPVIILGFENVPRVGEEFKSFPDLEQAKNHLQTSEEKTAEIISPSKILKDGADQKVLNLILKTDVLGSTEAIEEVLKGLDGKQIVLKILKSEVGEINESDVKLAKGGKTQILGFRVKINPIARNLAEREKIKIRRFEVIYELVEEVRNLMEKLIEPEVVRINLGKVKALVIFLAEKNRQIVGGKVIEGEVKKGALIEVFRNEEEIGQGKIVNLQRNKKDIDSVPKGEECGLLYEGGIKIAEGDILTIYTEERKKSKL